MHRIESSLAFHSMKQEIEPVEAIPKIASLAGRRLRNRIQQLQRKEKRRILQPLEAMPNEQFREKPLTLSETAILAFQYQNCLKLIDRLPDLTDSQLRILITLAPQSLSETIFSRLYSHQIASLVPYLEAEKMESLVQVAPASTFLSLLPSLSLEQLRAALRFARYDLYITLLPLIPRQHLEQLLPHARKEYLEKFALNLRELPDEVLRCQLPKVAPIHLAALFASGASCEWIRPYFHCLNSEQIRFCAPHLEPQALSLFIQTLSPEKQDALVRSLSTQQMEPLQAFYQKRLINSNQQLRKTRQQFEILKTKWKDYRQAVEWFPEKTTSRVHARQIRAETKLKSEMMELIRNCRALYCEARAGRSLTESKRFATMERITETMGSQLHQMLREIQG